MTTLAITYYNRPVSLEEAIEAEVAEDHNEYGGIVEGLRTKLEQQNKLIARVLAVQFGQYADHFTGPEYEPKTDAEKLAFILPNHKVYEA